MKQEISMSYGPERSAPQAWTRASVLRLVSLWMVSLLLIASCSGGGGDGPPEQGPGTRLMLTGVSVEGRDIVVTGSTDLPDESLLTIGFGVLSESGAGTDAGVSTVAHVSQGEFEARIVPPQTEEFKRGPYQVSVFFTPREQIEEVLFIVGVNGDKLSGELVEDAGSYKTLRLIDRRDLRLNFTPLIFTFQEPPEFQQGTAERALAEFVWGWKNKDWATMNDFSEKTWLSHQDNPTRILEAWYDPKSLQGFNVTEVKELSESLTEITFVVQYETVTKQIIQKQVIAKVVKEAIHTTTGKRLVWGVNPISTLALQDLE